MVIGQLSEMGQAPFLRLLGLRVGILILNGIPKGWDPLAEFEAEPQAALGKAIKLWLIYKKASLKSRRTVF